METRVHFDCKIYMQYSQLPLINWHLYKLDTSLRQTPVSWSLLFIGHFIDLLWFFNFWHWQVWGKSVNTNEKSTLKLVKLRSLKVISWKGITFKFGSFSNVKVLFPVVPMDFPYKMIHTKCWKNHENVYSLYKTVRTLRGTKNTFETINGQ